MMMREQQWDRSNCRHFRIDVCLHQRIYMRAFVNGRILYCENVFKHINIYKLHVSCHYANFTLTVINDGI